jgi:hypothetical protein
MPYIRSFRCTSWVSHFSAYPATQRTNCSQWIKQCFGALSTIGMRKHYWAKHRDRSITKQRFGIIVSIVWDKCMTPANIKSGFAATGIYPFNSDALPPEAFAPSSITERKDPNHNANSVGASSTNGSTSQRMPATRDAAPPPGLIFRLYHFTTLSTQICFTCQFYYFL